MCDNSIEMTFDCDIMTFASKCRDMFDDTTMGRIELFDDDEMSVLNFDADMMSHVMRHIVACDMMPMRVTLSDKHDDLWYYDAERFVMRQSYIPVNVTYADHCDVHEMMTHAELTQLRQNSPDAFITILP